MKKNTTLALLLIIIAAYLIVSRLGFWAGIHIPVFRILFTLVFAYAAVTGFVKLNFMQGFLSLGIVGCLNDRLLHIERLTPVTLMLAAFLLGLAFDMIFREAKQNRLMGEYSTSYTETIYDMNEQAASEQSRTYAGNNYTQTADYGPNVKFDNLFGTLSKYISASNMQTCLIDNTFGTATIYFNGATLAPGAYCKVDSTFSTTNLYLPKNWRITVRQDCVFGTVKYHGMASNDPNAPTLDLILNANFATINLYFE